MLSSLVNSHEPALKHRLPSPESHQPAGTTQSVFTPHTSPYKHCCLLIEHHQRTNGHWCSWGLDTSAPHRFFFSQHALIEWFQWSLRVLSILPRLLSERLSATAPERLARNVLYPDCGYWSSELDRATERPSITRLSRPLFKKQSLSKYWRGARANYKQMVDVPGTRGQLWWMQGAELRAGGWGGGGKCSAGVFWMMEHSMGCESGPHTGTEDWQVFRSAAKHWQEDTKWKSEASQTEEKRTSEVPEQDWVRQAGWTLNLGIRV